jgi:hypothetical protein
MVSRRDVLSAGGLIGLGGASFGSQQTGRAGSAPTSECFSLWRTRIAPGMNYVSGVTRALDAELAALNRRPIYGSQRRQNVAVKRDGFG